jgi:uncharacterized protein (TIGR02246 family)
VTIPKLAAALALAILVHAPAAQADAVRDAVEANNRAFIVALLGGDAKAIAELYTETAEVIPPGAPAARGRTAIAAHWQAAIDAGVKAIELETTEVESSGDLASETGIVRLVARDGAASSARYLVVWKRVDGVWKLHRDIWNAER